MRLLLVTQDFPPNTGGIETYCFELAKRFSKCADQFAVLAPFHHEAQPFDQSLDYPVFRILTKNSLLPLTAPIPQLWFSLKNKFDTVYHAQWQTLGTSLFSKKLGYPQNIYAAAHARELLIPPFNGQGGWLTRRMHSWRKKMLQQVDGFFPVSNYTASLLKGDGVDENKIHVVGNGTDPNVYKPQDFSSLAQQHQVGDKKVLLTICRLVERKGIDLVLKALRQITRNRKDVLYLIGGSGPDRHRLESLVAEYELQKYVRFLGRVPDEEMAGYYTMSDVFVMPACNAPPDVEGFGIVFLEANACETAVIGAKTGGIPDAVVHEKTGYLIEEQDVNELILYLEKLLNDPQFSTHMGKEGRKRVLEYANWDKSAEAIWKKMQLINRRSER